MSLPKPTKVSAEGSDPVVYGCIYESGCECKFPSMNVLPTHDNGARIRVPLTFQKKCRKEIMTHQETIRSWFNPRPSSSDLERYVSTPDTHTTLENRRDQEVAGLKMAGILIDNGRIYPKYEVIWKKKSPVGLVMSLDNDIVEITDLDVPGDDDTGSTVVLKAPQNVRHYDDGDDETDEEGTDGGEDDDGFTTDDVDDDDEISDAIRKIQDTMDIAREELAKLARTRRK